MRDRYDVIVVGARVGGSTLTALLGDAGVSVLLLDRARFPSTTPSTHFFRGVGMVGVLERLGVLDAVLGLGCPALTREFNYLAGFLARDGTAPDAAEFSQLGDEMAYAFPGDRGLTCVAVSVNLEFRWMRQNLEARYDERIARHRGIAPRVAAATADGRLFGCGPERNYVRVPWGPGWALVGDASLHQDPWTGLGMDMAGVHATFLAEAIVDWQNGSADERTALAGYHNRRNAHALGPYHDTVRLAADLRALDR